MTLPGPRRRLGRILGNEADEVEDELRFHLERQVEDLVAAGWPADAALEEARRMFGDVGRVRGEVRSLTRQRERRARRREHLGELGADLRFALRRIKREPLFALVTVGVLALGIGANAATFGVVDAALLRPLPFPDGGSIVYLWDDQDGSPTTVSYPEFEDWEREGDFLASNAAIYRGSMTWQDAGGPERLSVAIVGGDLLGVAALTPVLGRGFGTTDARGSSGAAMLSEEFWRDRFAASPEVVGTTLDLNGKRREIVGVMPAEAGLLGETAGVGIWLPMEERDWMSRGLHFMRVVGRLRPGVELQEARVRAASMAVGLQQSGVTRHGVSLQTMRERLVGDVRPLLLVLWGAVGFLLLIVCTNLANLFLSQATGRAREFAVRGALGAGRFRLARQLLTESLVLGLLGGALGLGLSRLTTGYVAAAAERAALLATPGLDWRVAGYTFGMALLVSVVFGLTPAAHAMSRELSADLKDRAPGRAAAGRGLKRFGRLLVGAQVALSLILLAGAGLMIATVIRLLNEDPGFDAGGIVTVEIDLTPERYADDESRVRFFDDVVHRIRRLPGVTEAAATSHIPLSGDDTDGSFQIPGREYTPEETPHSQKRIATPGYFETMHIPLLRGRTFQEGDGREGREVAIISESLAERYWPGSDPVGQRLRFAWGTDGEQEIVGVVGDIRHDGLDLPVEGTIYIPQALFAASSLIVVVRATSDPAGLVAIIRREVQALDPLQPIHSVATLESIVSGSVTTQRVFMTLLSGFAVVALLLAAVGVYAVTAGSVAGRTREIGLRLAVGAAPRRVLTMILLEELRVIVPGLVLGLLGAVALTRTLEALLYQVSPTDPIALTLVAVLLSVVAITAVLVPARRAAALDPTETLRTE